MWKKKFWADALERAIKTFAQTAVSVLSVKGLGLLDVQWQGLLSAAGLAALVSILSSIASYTMNTDGTASMVP